MRRSDVIKRHGDRTEAERQFLADNRRRFSANTNRLPHAACALDTVKGRVVENIVPLASHAIIRESWLDLEHALRTRSVEKITQLRRLMNGLLLPMAGIELSHEPIPVNHSNDLRRGDCSYAETAFFEAVKQVRTHRLASQSEIDIYHTALGKPLLFQKNRDNSTALALQTFDLEGMVIPAGMIVCMPYDQNISISRRRRINEGWQAFNINSHMVEAEQLVIDPLRLSPWAYEDPLDRALFALDGYDNDLYCSPERAHKVTKYDIDDFREAASRIIELCTGQQVLVTAAS